MQRIISSRWLQVTIAIALIAVSSVNVALAWQNSMPFGHTNRYGGEADSGTMTGQVEYAGTERRIRAGGQNVKWTAAGIAWMKAASGIPAMVFHATPKDQNGDVCGKVRTVGGWSWGNLPGQAPETKGCGWGDDNEVRFYFDENSTVGGVSYWFQSLFRDTGYSGAGTPKEPGQIVVDTYWTMSGIRQNNDFHGKICFENNSTRNPAAGACLP